MIDHYRIDTPGIISFSGGATSEFMLWQVLRAYGGTLPDDIKVVFANTGLEHPATLEFIRDVSQNWGVKVHWLEYRPKKSWVEVTYETASRNGGFRSDRPSYRGLIQMAESQQEFRFPDDDTLPCHCTD